jgi:uncharacterized protein
LDGLADILLVIFCREPIKGKVKTRLAHSIGEARTLQIYRNLLSNTIQSAKELDCQILLLVTDPITKTVHLDWTESLPFEIQCGGDLGQRMSMVFERYCKEGRSVILMGSDCPDLDSAHLKSAIDGLKHADVVLGPASDGGYYLIGMKKHHPELFINIEWSSDKVLMKTLEKIKSIDANLHLLPVLTDIDTEEDLIRTKFINTL